MQISFNYRRIKLRWHSIGILNDLKEDIDAKWGLISFWTSLISITAISNITCLFGGNFYLLVDPFVFQVMRGVPSMKPLLLSAVIFVVLILVGSFLNHESHSRLVILLLQRKRVKKRERNINPKSIGKLSRNGEPSKRRRKERFFAESESWETESTCNKRRRSQRKRTRLCPFFDKRMKLRN